MSEYPKDTLQKIAALAGIIGPIIHVLTIILLDALWFEYNPMHQFMSELSASDLAFGVIMQLCGYLPLGISWLFLTIALYRGVNRLHTISISTYFFAIASIALILLSFFPCDPGCQTVSFSGHMHEILGIIENVSFILGMLMIIYPLSQSMRG